MLTPTTGTVPETLRPDAAPPGLDTPDAPAGDRPAAVEPSTESLASEARRVARGEGPAAADGAALRDAIRASEAADGALATEARVRDGSLVGADGSALLGDLGSEERARVADQYVADLRERAAGPGPAPSAAAERLGYETELVREHLGPHYVDPDAALDRLHSLDAEGRAALTGGDASVLGERRPDAPEPDLQTDALVAHRDVYDRHPDEASWVEAARDQARATPLLNEIDPEPERPTRSFGIERGGPNDPSGDLEPPGGGAVAMPGLQESMEHRVIAHAMSPHQI